MGTGIPTETEEKTSSLKIILPRNIKPKDYLVNSVRFKGWNFDSFESLRQVLKECYDIDFEIVEYGNKDNSLQIDILEKSEYIAFLPVDDDKSGQHIEDCKKLGIPVIFIRYDSKMDCETINCNTEQTECYKYRPSCSLKEGEHCEGMYFSQIQGQFAHGQSTIRHAVNSFGTDVIPLFTMSFLIDFIIWYCLLGLKIKKKNISYLLDKERKQFLDKVGVDTIANMLNKGG